MSHEYVSPEVFFNNAIQKITSALREEGYEGEVVGNYRHETIETDFAIVRLSYHIAAYNKKTGRLFSDFPRSFNSYFSSVAPEEKDKEKAHQTIKFLAGKYDSPWGRIMAW